MSVVKLDALAALQCALTEAVPDLDGRICVGIGPPGHKLAFPSLAIDPVRFSYKPYQAAELATKAVDRVVMDVGIHEVMVQLRITASNAQQRYELEQAVTDLFLSQPLTPGVLVTPVSGCYLLSDFQSTWIFDDSEWGNGMAFEQVYESTITVLGEIPALVTRMDAYPIRHLQLGLTHDMSSPPPAFVATSTFEIIEATSDGTAVAP